MRQLYPTADAAIDPRSCYATDARPAPADRPWTLVNMIASIDGGTAVDGRSGDLGGPADKAVFAAIRAVPDVILVAAGTVRAERYGPVQLSAEARRERAARGQATVPRLAVVTASLDLDLSAPLFQDPSNRPLVLTVAAAPADRREAVAAVADVVELGQDRVDLPLAMRHLRTMGAQVVLCEGGPSLNGALVAADLVDELCLSLSNVLVAGSSSRVAHGAPAHVGLHLRRILEADGLLFLRYSR